MRRAFWLILPFCLAVAAAPACAGHEDGDEEGAHEEHGKPERAERLLEMLDKRLELKPEQREKVKRVLDETSPQLEALQKEMKGLREKMKAQGDKMKAVFQGQSEKIRSLLSDDQKWKFDEISVKMRERMKGGRKRGGRGGEEGPWRRPGPPDEDDRGEPGPRDLPPPEVWHDKAPKGQREHPEHPTQR